MINRNNPCQLAIRYSCLVLLLVQNLCAQSTIEPEPYLKPNGSFFESSFSRLFTSQQNLYYLAGGTIATILAFQIDDEVDDKLGGHEDVHTALGATLGGPTFLSISAVMAYAGGHLTKTPHIANTGLFLMESLAFTYLVTATLKAMVKRPRPNDDNNLSFPSGHTSGSFAFASVLDRRYGWKIGVPAYLYASAIGFSRIRLSKHYLSDVMAGATLGLLVGRSFPVPRGEASNISWQPIIGSHYAGIKAVVQW